MKDNLRAGIALVLVMAVCAGLVFLFGHYGWFWGVASLAGGIFAFLVVRYVRARGKIESAPAASYIEQYRSSPPRAAAAASSTSPAPQGAPQYATGDQRTMRTLGKISSNTADLLWAFTVIGFVLLLGIFPKVSAIEVPYFDRSIVQLLVLTMAPALMALVFFNLLSGRWPVAEHRRRNLIVSRLAFIALLVIAGVVFLLNRGVTGLPVLTFQEWTVDVDLLAKIGLVGAIIFSFVDYIYTKGDDFVASSMKDQDSIAAALRARVSALEGENARLNGLVAQRPAYKPPAAPSAANLSPVYPAPVAAAVVSGPVGQEPGRTALVLEIYPEMHDDIGIARRLGHTSAPQSAAARVAAAVAAAPLAVALSGTVDVRHAGAIELNGSPTVLAAPAPTPPQEPVQDEPVAPEQVAGAGATASPDGAAPADSNPPIAPSQVAETNDLSQSVQPPNGQDGQEPASRTA